MKQEEAVNRLWQMAEQKGTVTVLYGLFGSCVSVSIPFSKKACDTMLDELDLSVRASNAMKRTGIFTVGPAIDMIENNGLLRIRNLGKKTQNEIKTRILSFGYDHLSDAEKKYFFHDALRRNRPTR